MSKNLSFNPDTSVLSVKSVPGVTYKIDGRVVSGEIKLKKDTVVTASPMAGFSFPEDAETEFSFEVSKPADEKPAENPPQNPGGDETAVNVSPLRPNNSL